MNIVSLDPGGTTGIVIAGHPEEVETYDAEHMIRRQIGPDEHHLELEELFDHYRPVVIVCESFTWRPNLRRDYVELVSKEYIGVSKLWCRRWDVKYVEQQPSQAMNFWTDDKIKKLGLWKPSMKHAMDATRHMLYYLVFKQKRRDILEGLK